MQLFFVTSYVGSCGSLNEHDPHRPHEFLAPIWWNYWGRIRRFNLVGRRGVTGVGYDVKGCSIKKFENNYFFNRAGRIFFRTVAISVHEDHSLAPQK